MGDVCVIYYWGDVWSEVPGRQRNLMLALSQMVPVFYLDAGGDRFCQVSTFCPSPGLTVVTGLARKLNAMARRRLGLAAKAFGTWHISRVTRGYRRRVLWYAENHDRLDRFIPHSVMVHDCIDPCLDEREGARAVWLEREKSVIVKSRKVFVTAESLAEICAPFSNDVMLLPNAADLPEFGSLGEITTSEPRTPQWWFSEPGDERPIITYLGGLNERFDFDLMMAVCQQCTEVRYVFTSAPTAECVSRVTALGSLPNVRCTGMLTNSNVEFVLARTSVGIIPFKMNAIGDAINPNKLFIYAIRGIPIVATATREMLRYRKFVRLARTPSEFVQAIRLALTRTATGNADVQLRQFGENNTWDHRAADAWKAIQSL
jgi:hypothetical protein